MKKIHSLIFCAAQNSNLSTAHPFRTIKHNRDYSVNFFAREKENSCFNCMKFFNRESVFKNESIDTQIQRVIR